MFTEDHGKLILRLTLGILILLHGVAKLSNGIAGIVGRVEGVGLPAAFAYLVYVGEVVAPLFLLAGVFTRVAAWLIVCNMVVALLLVHLGQIFTLTPQGGWTLELQAFYLLTALAITALGAGRFSVGGRAGRWN
jgi:putative oxidoreductase